MKTKLTLLTLFLIAAGAALAPAQYTMQPESRIWIEGTSSVHDWTCEVEQFSGSLTAAEAIQQVDQVSVSVPVQEIACKNGTMNRKTHGALEAKKHPVITYTLQNAEVVNTTPEGTFDLEVTGTLQMAGAERTVTFVATGEAADDGEVRFTGQVPLVMSDFGISPPTAMLGTLKTGDEVTVHFDVVAAR